MEKTIARYLEVTEIGPGQAYKNLAVYPLLSAAASTLDYLTLDEALPAGLVEITEIDPGGSVPELKLLNKSARRVLILDGEELVGAKQNRIVNTTILVEAEAVTILPVSCVEAGRWSYRTERFGHEERLMSARMRAMKSGQVHESVRASRQYRSDQGAIWHEIEEHARRRGAESPSMAMSEIYEKERPGLDEYVSRFQPLDGQVGALFAINGKVVGLDSFDKPETLSRVFRKLVTSYALDAIDWLKPEEEHPAKEAGAAEFLRQVPACSAEAYPSVALGTDWRLASDKATGFALLVDEQVVHLSVFARQNGGRGAGAHPGMRRFSSRRRTRG